MSADHHDRAGPARLAAENGTARDEDHLEPSGDVTAILVENDTPSGRLANATSVPTAADFDTIENREINGGGPPATTQISQPR